MRINKKKIQKMQDKKRTLRAKIIDLHCKQCYVKFNTSHTSQFIRSNLCVNLTQVKCVNK